MILEGNMVVFIILMLLMLLMFSWFAHRGMYKRRVVKCCWDEYGIYVSDSHKINKVINLYYSTGYSYKHAASNIKHQYFRRKVNDNSCVE